MALNIDKYVNKKFHKFISYIGCFIAFTLLGFIILIVGHILIDFYNINYRYSIAMPVILGDFYINGDYIKIEGIENIINDEIATLGINEFTCDLFYKTCYENRAVVVGLAGQTNIFPYHNEYKITYYDKNKIIFKNDSLIKSGEIDLDMKTLVFNTTSIFNKEPRKIEIITNNEQIKKLEKNIIKKHLKKKFLSF